MEIKRALLKHEFADPRLNLTLELFLRMIGDFFGERLVSVVLYGSVVFDDLAPGYGDLDFLAVVDDNLSEETCRDLIELRKPLRGRDSGMHSKMIEGAFLPRKMLNPINTGKAFWWGTSSERPWESNQLGWLVLHVIRERGLVIWGEDIRNEIPAASREALIGDVRMACKSMREQGRGGSIHSVDWLLTAARLLLWLKEGRLSSKSEAADWGYVHAKGGWRKLLPRAKEIRLNPKVVVTVEIKEWLDKLTGPIREACEEVEHELDSINITGQVGL
jgi:predicted nucleotidyltransferase